MVATSVIGCGYNYSSIRLVIHRGSFRSFVALHQESGRLARDGRLSMSRMISSPKSRAEAMHIHSSFAKPNTWITDTENCRWHNLHMDVDGQSQWCSLIPAARPCDNCLQQSRAMSLQPPPPIAGAQGAGDGAHLFHEWGSYILDEFSSICYSWWTQLCRNPTLKECEVTTHTPENGTWESFRTLENSEFDCRGQNTLPWGVLYIVGKVLKCKCPKWPRMSRLDIYSTSYGRKKGQESNWQFDSRPLKVGNRPDPGVCKWSATHRWKALKDNYKFASDFILIRGLSKKVWMPKVPWVQTRTISRQKAIWMWSPWRGAKYTIWGKVVASPEFGPWWVKWVQSYPWLVLAPRVLQNVN